MKSGYNLDPFISLQMAYFLRNAATTASSGSEPAALGSGSGCEAAVCLFATRIQHTLDSSKTLRMIDMVGVAT
jgi:hypothetical protein